MSGYYGVGKDFRKITLPDSVESDGRSSASHKSAMPGFSFEERVKKRAAVYSVPEQPEKRRTEKKSIKQRLMKGLLRKKKVSSEAQPNMESQLSQVSFQRREDAFAFPPEDQEIRPRMQARIASERVTKDDEPGAILPPGPGAGAEGTPHSVLALEEQLTRNSPLVLRKGGQFVKLTIKSKNAATEEQALHVTLRPKAEGFGLHLSSGLPPIVVTFVQPGGDAELAGVKVGDVILEVNGQDCRTESSIGIASLMELKMMIQKVTHDQRDEFSSEYHEEAKAVDDAAWQRIRARQMKDDRDLESQHSSTMELTYIDSVSDVTGSVENLTDEKKQHKKDTESKKKKKEDKNKDSSSRKKESQHTQSATKKTSRSEKKTKIGKKMSSHSDGQKSVSEEKKMPSLEDKTSPSRPTVFEAHKQRSEEMAELGVETPSATTMQRSPSVDAMMHLRSELGGGGMGGKSKSQAEIRQFEEAADSNVRVKKSGVVIGPSLSRSSSRRPSIFATDEFESDDIDYRKVTFAQDTTDGGGDLDFSAIPKMAPSLGIRVGHDRRDLAMRRKSTTRRPSTIRRSDHFSIDAKLVPDTNAAKEIIKATPTRSSPSPEKTGNASVTQSHKPILIPLSLSQQRIQHVQAASTAEMVAKAAALQRQSSAQDRASQQQRRHTVAMGKLANETEETGTSSDASKRHRISQPESRLHAVDLKLGSGHPVPTKAEERVKRVKSVEKPAKTLGMVSDSHTNRSEEVAVEKSRLSEHSEPSWVKIAQGKQKRTSTLFTPSEVTIQDTKKDDPAATLTQPQKDDTKASKPSPAPQKSTPPVAASLASTASGKKPAMAATNTNTATSPAASQESTSTAKEAKGSEKKSNSKQTDFQPKVGNVRSKMAMFTGK